MEKAPQPPEQPKKELSDLEQLEKYERAQEERETPQLIQQRAFHDIDRMWELITLTDGLPLSVDPAYEFGKRHIEHCAEKYARVLFKEARDSVGRDRLRNAAALFKLLSFISREQSENILEQLLTTKEAIKELLKKGMEELPSQERKKMRKIIDELEYLTF